MINGGRIHPYARHHKHHMQGGDIFTTENLKLGLKYGPGIVNAAVNAAPAIASGTLATASALNYGYQHFVNNGQETPQTAFNAKVIKEASDALKNNYGHSAAGLASELASRSYQTTGDPVQKKDFGLPTLSIIAPPPLIGRSGRPFGPKQLWDKRPGRARFKRSLKPLHSSSSSKPPQRTKKAGSKKKKGVRRKGGALINNTGADSHPSAHGYNWTSVQH